MTDRMPKPIITYRGKDKFTATIIHASEEQAKKVYVKLCDKYDEVVETKSILATSSPRGTYIWTCTNKGDN